MIFIYLLLIFSQWANEVRLTNASGLSYVAGQNAWAVAAANDTVWVVWYDNRNGRWQIYYKYSTNGGAGWTADAMVADSGMCPSVTIPYPIGTHPIYGRILSYATFMRYYDNWEIMASFYTPNWGWITTRFTSNAGSSIYPSITADSSYILLTWMDNRTGDWEIRFRRSTDYGNGWSSDAALTSSLGHSWLPQSALSKNKFYVVWQDKRDGNFEIYFKKSTDAGTTWSTDTRLTYTSTQTYWPSIAVSGQYIYVAYVEKGDYLVTDDNIYFIRSTDEGNTWSSPILLSLPSSTRDTLEGNQLNSIYPSLVANKNFVGIAYLQAISQETYAPFDSQQWRINFQRSSNYGTTWSSAERITTTWADDSLIWFPSLCADQIKDIAYITWWKLVTANNAEVFLRKGTGVIGIEEIQKADKGKSGECIISPNPFRRNLNIKFLTQLKDNTGIIIYDILGQVVKELPSTSSSISTTQHLIWDGTDNNGNCCRPGVYFVMFQAKDGKRVLMKVCKLE